MLEPPLRAASCSIQQCVPGALLSLPSQVLELDFGFCGFGGLLLQVQLSFHVCIFQTSACVNPCNIGVIGHVINPEYRTCQHIVA